MKKATELNITVTLMIGGAGGAYQVLFSDFEVYYKLLKDTIDKYDFISGVDLDVEEFVPIDQIQMLINRLKKENALNKEGVLLRYFLVF